MSQDTKDPKIQAYYRKQRKDAELSSMKGDSKGKATLGKIVGKLDKGGNKSSRANEARAVASGGSRDAAKPVNVEDDPAAYLADPAVGLGKLAMRGGAAVAKSAFPKVLDAAAGAARGAFPKAGEALAKGAAKKALPKPAPRAISGSKQAALPKPKGKLGPDFKQPKVVKAGTPRAKQTSVRAKGTNPRQAPDFKRGAAKKPKKAAAGES